MNAHTLPSMSPAQAAQAIGTSRWSVMRAINAGDLRATRDNHNAWRITAEDLDAWRSTRPAHGAAAAGQVSPAVGPAAIAQPGDTRHAEVEELRIGLAVATTRAEAAEARAVTAEADRDAWRAQAELLARSRELPTPAQPARRRWWSW